jgi:uncharacterized protein with PQ loop repeat
MEQVVGVVAAILSTVAGIPQLIAVYKPHTTNHLSIKTQCLHFFSAILWCVYGVLIHSNILAIECLIVTCIYFFIICAIVRDRIFITVPVPSVEQTNPKS